MGRPVTTLVVMELVQPAPECILKEQEATADT